MYVMQLSDGRYIKNIGSHAMITKDSYERWVKVYPDVYNTILNDQLTNDLLEARLFKSVEACRASNARSWDAKIVEVEVSVRIKD
jgi:hypothetical protein